jgi:hypothetical protein
MITERELVLVDPAADELRRRLRAIVLELVPNKWGIRGTLFRIIDHASPSVLLSMRDRIRELVR